MSKAMTIAGMVVAALVFVVFVLDLVVGSTGFNKMHIGAIIASLILGYISFSTFREQK